MGNVLDNSLYMNDQKKFQELFQAVIQFNSLYNGNNIIQDDIFSDVYKRQVHAVHRHDDRYFKRADEATGC